MSPIEIYVITYKIVSSVFDVAVIVCGLLPLILLRSCIRWHRKRAASRMLARCPVFGICDAYVKHDESQPFRCEQCGLGKSKAQSR